MVALVPTITRHSIINRLLLFLFISIPHYYLGRYWPVIEKHLSPDTIKSIFPSLAQTISVLACILFYGVIYYFEFDFVEKFKANEVAWPWKGDKNKWKAQLKRLTWVYFRNFFIIGTVATTIVDVTSSIGSSSASYPSL